MSLFDSEEIGIPCESCGRETKKTIGWIKHHRELTCACGTVIRLNADELLRGIDQIEASIAKVERAFKKLSK